MSYLNAMGEQDFDLGRNSWCGDYNEASTYLDLFTTYSGHNNGKFVSADYDKLMNKRLPTVRPDGPNCAITSSETPKL